MGATMALPQEAQDALRSRFSAVNDTGWVLRLAARAGWQQANRRYLGSARARGTAEMAALMQAAAITRLGSIDEAVQLLEMALSFWAPGTRIKRLPGKRDEAVVDIRVVNCPTYAQIEKAGWHGVTACGSWHRRRGWYDALGVEAKDFLLREKKWGYGACVARVTLRLA